MNQFRKTLSAATVGTLLCLSGTAGADGTSTANAPVEPDAMPVHARAVEADFDAIRFGVESAIENRGFVIDYHANIGDMLERTTADVDAGETPYRAAETWQFCSAILSRRMVQADPENIAYCPYVVFAYETREAPGTVVVGFRTRSDSSENGSSEVIAVIDRELAAIVAEATD